MADAARIETHGGDQAAVRARGRTFDLEAWRRRNAWTYGRLAEFLNLGDAAAARFYCIGARWPSPERLQKILEKTGGAVSVVAMHDKRLAWTRAQQENGCEG